MEREQHLQYLKQMYRAAPINEFYRPTMELAQGRSTIAIETNDSMYHTFGFVHGSVYFKMLDDAAYFAAHTLEKEYFLLTADFRTDFIRPFQSGSIVCEGSVEHVGRKDILARAVLRANDKVLATGTGRFSRSNWTLKGQGFYRRSPRTS